MRSLVAWSILVTAAAVSLWCLFGVYITPHERGVRYIRYGPNPGIRKELIGPGVTWRIPFFNEITQVPVTVQSFQIQNKRHLGANPHRNALYLTIFGQLESLNVEVRYRVRTEAIVQYANTYYGFSPRVIVEGVLRAKAFTSQYESYEQLEQDVRNTLEKTGIMLLSIHPLDRNSENKFNPNRLKNPSKRAS